jgi:hypothetical protein
MEILIALVVIAALGFALYKHVTLASLKAEAKSLVTRLESYATAEEGKVKAFIAAEAARLKAKL